MDPRLAFIKSSPGRRALVSALVFGLGISLLGACDQCSGPPQSLEVAPKAQTPRVEWQEPEALDLQDPAPYTEHLLRLAEAVNYPECHEIFEPDGEAVDWPWLMDT